MPSRPALSRKLTAEEFASWYWLKSELQAFCREQGASAAGSKHELSGRIMAILAGQPLPAAQAPRGKREEMPSVFTADTVIGEGWRFTQALREYFQTVFGPRFAFNGALRDFIVNGKGKTLAQASACYAASRNTPAERIAPQFEYNRHIRDFFQRNPGATHRQAVEAWWARREKSGD